MFSLTTVFSCASVYYGNVIPAIFYSRFVCCLLTRILAELNLQSNDSFFVCLFIPANSHLAASYDVTLIGCLFAGVGSSRTKSEKLQRRTKMKRIKINRFVTATEVTEMHTRQSIKWTYPGECFFLFFSFFLLSFLLRSILGGQGKDSLTPLRYEQIKRKLENTEPGEWDSTPHSRHSVLWQVVPLWDAKES